ncbi:MAG TPA: histidine phosphatase family protein [Jiangellaceae bacterium]
MGAKRQIRMGAAVAQAAALLTLVVGACEAPTDTASPVVNALRDGGHVLVLRHTATGSGVDTTDDPTDCERQRNLSSEGRADAEAIGRALDELGIPISDVRASPMCRTMDTARLAFGETEADERLLQSADPAGVRTLLEAATPPDGNRVLVGHQGSILEATGVDLEEGEMAVFGPDGDPVTTFSVEDWARLLE